MPEVMFLLGAGASYEAGLPLGNALTRPVVEQLPHLDDPPSGPTMLAINYAIARLAVGDSIEPNSPFNYPDFEVTLSALDLLRDLPTLEIAPFIEAWDATVTRLSTMRSNPDLDLGALSRIIKANTDSPGGGHVASIIQGIAHPNQAAYSAFDGTGFFLRRALIPVLERLGSVDYLKPLVEGSAHPDR